MNRCTKALVLVAALPALMTTPALAASGDPDPAFGSGGQVLTDFGGDDEARDVAIDGEGRIIAAGTGGISDPARPGATGFSLARYLPDGSLDPSFGDGGRVQTDFGSMTATVRSIEIDSQGRIVAVGGTFASDATGAAIALARYLPDGSLDPSFGDGGTVVTEIGLSGALDAVLDSQGRIVAVGATSTPLVLPTVLRYLQDGTLDPAFSGDGVRRIRGGKLFAFPALAVDSSDRVALAGSTDTARGGRDRFTVMRLTAAGANDPSFGRSGRAILLRGFFARATAIESGPFGLTVAGECACGKRGRGQFVVTRVDDAGASVPGFGGKDGIALIKFAGSARATSVAVAANLDVVVGGDVPTGGLSYAASGLARLTPFGKLDRTFSQDGKLVVVPELRDGPAPIAALALDASGAILTASRRSGPTNPDFAISRYLP